MHVVFEAIHCDEEFRVKMKISALIVLRQAGVSLQFEAYQCLKRVPHEKLV